MFRNLLLPQSKGVLKQMLSQRSITRLQISYIYVYYQGPLLLTWFNFNPSMDK